MRIRCLACLTFALMFCAAAAPQDVSPWVISQLKELCQRGLISGYPAGPLPLPEHPTRHEVASLVLRAVQGVAGEFRAAAESLEGEEETPAPQVRMEDLARLEKLIAELRTELVSMGTDVSRLERSLKGIQGSLAATQEQVRALAQQEQAHHLSGYIQFRYDNDEAQDPHSRFAVRRARLAIGGPAAGGSYKIEIAGDQPPGQTSSSITLKDAYLGRIISGWQVRAGQMKIPFGIEVFQSDADRLPPEISRFADNLFPGQRDRGIAVFSPSGRFTGTIAVFNGSGIETSDTDNRKDVVARIGYDSGRGSFGASAYGGQRVTESGTSLKTRLGVDAILPLQGAALQGEYVAGHGEFIPGGVESDTPVRGWYLQGSMPLRGKPGGTVFARRDEFDPDTDSPGDEFLRTTLGWAWEPDRATRLTAAMELKKDRSTRDSQNAFTLQWQLRY